MEIDENTITIEDHVYQASDMLEIHFGPILLKRGGSIPGMSILWQPGKEASFNYYYRFDQDEVAEFAKRNNIPIKEVAAI